MTGKFDKFCRAVMGVLFLAFIFGMLFLTAYRMKTRYTDYSYFENRKLATFPEIQTEEIVNGKFFSKAETWLKDHVACRDAVIKYKTLSDIYLLHRPVVNSTIICDGLLLPYNDFERINEKKINTKAAKMAKRLAIHTQTAEEVGASFYYVAVPCQYVFYADKYPWYLNSRAEYIDKSSRALFSELDQRGVDYIDMRAVFDSLGNQPGFSSTVDNHYGMEGAYETYRAILEKYNADTGAGLHILSDGDYTITELPNKYLGSRGRKLMGLVDTDEHLSILTPIESIPFKRWNWGNDFCSPSTVYSLPKNDTENVLYTMYMGGDISITKIETERPNLPKILIYGDSFTNEVESIIWYNFDKMYSLDFRMYKDMTLDEFIRDYKPDLVVCIRDYSALLNLYGNGK